jgi:hypothetical protein
MRSLVKLSAVFAFVALTAYAPAVAPTMVAAATGPQLKSIGPLSFGPNGVLLVGDQLAATVYAVDLGAQANGGAPGTADISGVDQKIAMMLGTEAKDIAITDLAVDQKTHNSYISVMRGQGPAAKPALLRVDGAGKITTINTDTLTYTSVTLPNPANETQPQNGRGANQRMQSITQLRYADGKVWISGLSNEEFASKMWSVAYPFAKADSGTSLEIYHDNHQQLETRAPMYAFIPYILNNQPYIIGAYTCTPLVKFPVSDLKPNSGNKFRGTTIGELGAGSRPIDMILYKKGGKEFLLLANTARGVMKIPTDSFANATPLTTPSNAETAGVPFEKVASMAGVQQLDLLDATHSIVVQGMGSPLNLHAQELP